MFPSDVQGCLPVYWSKMDLTDSHFEIVEVLRGTMEYATLNACITGPFNAGTDAIYRIQNPYLYIKYKHKLDQYRRCGSYVVKRLFHDSSRECVESIAKYNFDYRFGQRFQYGLGVYFSTTAFGANRCSNKSNGSKRAMFFASVPVGKIQMGVPGMFFPDFDVDTVASPNGITVVKYFDNEYYPEYVALYNSTR